MTEMSGDGALVVGHGHGSAAGAIVVEGATAAHSGEPYPHRYGMEVVTGAA